MQTLAIFINDFESLFNKVLGQSRLDRYKPLLMLLSNAYIKDITTCLHNLTFVIAFVYKKSSRSLLNGRI